MSANVEEVRRFVTKGIKLGQAPAATSQPLWKALAQSGSQLWLDTGDIDAAGALWCSEFQGLTTNNTLLNKEVQKGTYDELIAEANELLRALPENERVLEIGFILNARHGLRLAERFGCKVSVELHTHLADDLERSVHYGRRFHQICPSNFIVKLPWTAAGLIGTKRLRDEGVTINLTLGFSARQNYIAARAFHPHYVNVFLGRLNAYVSDNKLGDGRLVGEKATLASYQGTFAAVAGDSTPRTLQIAASLRSPDQVRSLAGVDVYTMPTAVADGVVKNDRAPFPSRVEENYAVQVDASARAEALWTIGDQEKAFADELRTSPPKTAADLQRTADKHGVSDLFPRLDANAIKLLDIEDKIPKHASWSAKIAAGSLAFDSLMNQAGLRSFAKDQAKLDERIRSLLARPNATSEKH